MIVLFGVFVASHGLVRNATTTTCERPVARHTTGTHHERATARGRQRARAYGLELKRLTFSMLVPSMRINWSNRRAWTVESPRCRRGPRRREFVGATPRTLPAAQWSLVQHWKSLMWSRPRPDLNRPRWSISWASSLPIVVVGQMQKPSAGPRQDHAFGVLSSRFFATTRVLRNTATINRPSAADGLVRS